MDILCSEDLNRIAHYTTTKRTMYTHSHQSPDYSKNNIFIFSFLNQFFISFKIYKFRVLNCSFSIRYLLYSSHFILLYCFFKVIFFIIYRIYVFWHAQTFYFVLNTYIETVYFSYFMVKTT